MKRFALLAFLLALPFVANAAVTAPPKDPSTATTETLGAIANTDGWCIGATTTAADLIAAAPARITPAIKAKIRFVAISHSDETDSTIDVCARYSTLSTGLTCALDTGTAGWMGGVGQSIRLVIARDDQGASIGPIWVVAASGTVSTCIDVGW